MNPPRIPIGVRGGFSISKEKEDEARVSPTIIENLRHFLAGFSQGQREKVIGLTCMEQQELENVFALLLLGSFVGFPAPPTFLAVELLRFMEREMQILGQRAEDACDMLGQMMGTLGVD